MSLRNVYRDIDLLTWVGEGSYPTVESFIQEAQLLGCSRRLPSMIPWAVAGKTRVFLVHRDNNQEKSCGSLFGFFVLNSVHVVYDDVTCGRRMEEAVPTLRSGTRPPRDVDEFEKYVIKRRIKFVRPDQVEGDSVVDELVKELAKEWLKRLIEEWPPPPPPQPPPPPPPPPSGPPPKRPCPKSREPDCPERLCGSDEWSGRYPGAYVVDALSDWVLDQILDLLIDPLPEEYFWEEIVEEDVVIRKKRKHKKVSMGTSRSGRVRIDEIGRPPPEVPRITVFEKPYHLYYHPPKASFRGFQRIDGDALLLKIGLPQYLAW